MDGNDVFPALPALFRGSTITGHVWMLVDTSKGMPGQ